jgi:hypothetical protein
VRSQSTSASSWFVIGLSSPSSGRYQRISSTPLFFLGSLNIRRKTLAPSGTLWHLILLDLDFQWFSSIWSWIINIHKLDGIGWIFSIL